MMIVMINDDSDDNNANYDDHDDHISNNDCAYNDNDVY